MKGLLSVFLFIYAAKNDGSKKKSWTCQLFFLFLKLTRLFCVQLDRHIGIALNE